MSTHRARAAYWSVIDTLIRQGGQFTITLVLARHIAPEEFGLIALLSIFTTVASIFIDGGMASALIQRQNHTQKDESTVFWFNFAIGSLMALIMILGGPLIAEFFNQPQLKPLSKIMALNLFLSALITVHVALLNKKMDFATQSKASIVAMIGGGIVAITMAYKGAGVWAIAAQTVVTTTITVIMIWGLHSWRPRLTFSTESYRNLFGFGGFVLASQIIDAIATRFYTVIIGRMHTAHDVGIYNRAITTRDFVTVMMSSSFGRMVFPLFSSKAHSTTLLKQGLRKSVKFMMALSVPIMFGIASVAEDLVPILFGDEWSESIPLLQVLCIAGVFWPMNLANLNALMAQGHSHLYLRVEIVKKLILLVSILAAAQYGIMAIAWATLFSSIFGLFINAYYSGKFLEYPLLSQIQDIAPYFLAALIMAALVHFGVGALSLNLQKITGLLLDIVIGALSYILIVHLLGADKPIIDLLKQARIKAGS